MSKAKFEMDLLDKILVDLYEKKAYFSFKRPSPILTGAVEDALEKEINKFSNKIRKLLKIGRESPALTNNKEGLDKIFKKANAQVQYYHIAINFLIINEYVEGVEDSIYVLRLTPKGVDSAKKVLENDWERQNKLSLRRISNLSVGLTVAIVIATVVNAYIAVQKFNNEPETKKWEQPQNHPAIKPDSLGIRNDSTIMY